MLSQQMRGVATGGTLYELSALKQCVQGYTYTHACKDTHTDMHARIHIHTCVPAARKDTPSGWPTRAPVRKHTHAPLPQRKQAACLHVPSNLLANLSQVLLQLCDCIRCCISLPLCKVQLQRERRRAAMCLCRCAGAVRAEGAVCREYWERERNRNCGCDCDCTDQGTFGGIE